MNPSQVSQPAERPGTPALTGLSEAGEARRRAMLSELQEQLSSLRSARLRRQQIGLAVGGLALAGIIAMVWWQGNRPGDLGPGPSPVAELPAPAPEVPASLASSAQPRSSFVVSRAQPEFLEVELIDDVELLDLLHEVGQPSGLARINGQAVVIPMPPRSAD